MIEYLTSIFVIPCSTFVIRFYKVSFSIRPAVFIADGWADTKNYLTEVTGHFAFRMINCAVDPRINLLVLDFLRIPT